jgi:hypothetical protein
MNMTLLDIYVVSFELIRPKLDFRFFSLSFCFVLLSWPDDYADELYSRVLEQMGPSWLMPASPRHTAYSYGVR